VITVEERCTECGVRTIMHHYINNLCYNCYENLFKSEAKEEEPDFVLEHETAKITVKPNTDSSLLYSEGQAFTLKSPKQYKLNHECRYGLDHDKLIKFLFDNFAIFDNAKGFDKVKYMFKEVE
jgi:hypothetical protein